MGYGSDGAHGALRLDICAMVQMRFLDPFGGGRLRCNMALRQGAKSPVLTFFHASYVDTEIRDTSGASVAGVCARGAD